MSADLSPAAHTLLAKLNEYFDHIILLFFCIFSNGGAWPAGDQQPTLQNYEQTGSRQDCEEPCPEKKMEFTAKDLRRGRAPL